jgi:hypothetical protein
MTNQNEINIEASASVPLKSGGHSGAVLKDLSSITIFENDQFTVVAPLTTTASCYYGAGTKWCTASSADNTHFNNYMKDGKLFYILDKTKATSDRFYKVALLKKFDGDESYFDAPDDKFTSGWIMGTNELARIKQYIDLYLREKYSKELEIWGDKEKAAIERKRLARVEQQRIENDLIDEANERRDNDEWSMDNLSEGDTGSCAHALFNFLISEGTIEAKTPESVEILKQAKEQLEVLQTRLDNEENANEDTDLVSEIEVLEDEITELENLKDVYINDLDSNIITRNPEWVEKYVKPKDGTKGRNISNPSQDALNIFQRNCEAAGLFYREAYSVVS